jgi:glyoxylase-like metal-dependent hydrolase (beta-lactamase superfamily II)
MYLIGQEVAMTTNSVMHFGSPALDRRHFLVGAAAGALALATGVRSASANSQIVHKARDVEVMTVSDGGFVLPINFLIAPEIPVEEREAALKVAGQSGERFAMANNVTLIRTRSELILVDAGFGSSSGQDTTGKLVENLKAAGIERTAITKVVITHCHPDHLWGSLDYDGTPMFPNAHYAISGTEQDFWLDPDIRTKLSGVFAGQFGERVAGGAQRHLSRIKDKVSRVKAGDEIVVSSVRVVDSAGHTPGHISIQVAGGDGLLVTGDAITNFVISFRYPSWRVPVDLDSDRAIVTRRRLLDQLAKDKTRIIGSHLPFPGTGFVEREGSAYRFVPAMT